MTQDIHYTPGPWLNLTRSPAGFMICNTGDPCWHVATHADKAKMLAAPDLLDALTELVERDRAEAAESGFTDDEMSWLDDARRAIAKAKGGAA